VEALIAADRDAGPFLETPPSAETAGESAVASPWHTLGPYRLLRRLGEGGMSVVYLAVRDGDEYRQQVAVKILRQGMDADARRRLRTERQILAALDHPHIARFLFGDTTEDGLPFFAMELVDGVRVDEHCRQNQLSVDERLALFLKICSAVEYAHRNLVVHRDLKPGNILVTRDGTPKLLDFGIAKLLNPELRDSELAATARWQRLLTPAYASPEQMRGEAITTATDVYSLGVLLFELLTGTLPIRFSGTSAPEVERAVLEQEPRRPSAAVLEIAGPAPLAATAEPGGRSTAARLERRRRRELHRRLAGDLDHILLKALRKEPARRYSSVEQLAEDVQRHLRGEPVRARKGTLAYRTGRFLKRHRWQVAALAAFVAVVLGFAAVMATQAGRIRRQAVEIAHERDEARRESDKRQRVLSFLEKVFAKVGDMEGRGRKVDAAEMMRVGVEMVGDGGEEPEVRADLLAALGRNLGSLRRYEQAEAVLQQALVIRRKVFGEDSLPVARTCYDLSDVDYQLARYPEAEAQARRAVALMRKHLKADDLELADALTTLATALFAQQRHAEAEAGFREALAIRKARLGTRRAEVVQSLNHLALTLAYRQRYREAEVCLREALNTQREIAGPLDWNLAYTLDNLAFALQEQGELDAAEPLLREALGIWRRTLAADDPQLGIALQGLGRLYLAQGKPRQAEAPLRELRDLVSRSLPAGHWGRAQAASLLGAALEAQGRFAEAEPLLAESLPVLRKARGAGHRDTRFAAAHLRALYEKTGRPELAARLWAP
jgi:eukaryotic-like serine/threonine-protein kinase